MPETAKDIIYSIGSPKTYTNFSGIELPEVDQKSQTFLKPLLRMGTSSSPISIGTTNVSPFEIFATSALTSGNERVMRLELATTAANASGQFEVLRVELDTEYRTGAWANAIMAQIDYGTAGFPHGMAASICAEMIPMNGPLTRGALYALDLEFGCGASSSWGSAGPVAFMKAENWGTATYFDDNAYFLHMASGCTAAAGHLVSAGYRTLRCRMHSTDMYMFFSQDEDRIQIGTSGSKKTLVTGKYEIEVNSTSDLTSGTQDVVRIKGTQTAAWQTGYYKGLRVEIDSDVKTPSSFYGISSIVNLQTNGYVWGDSTAVNCEMTLPNSAPARGQYSCVKLQIIGAASSGIGGSVWAIIQATGSGTMTAIDDNAFFLHLSGFTANGGHMVDSTANSNGPQIDHTLKCYIDGIGTVYIPLMDNADCS